MNETPGPETICVTCRMPLKDHLSGSICPTYPLTNHFKASTRMRYFIEVTEDEARQLCDDTEFGPVMGASGPSPMPGNRKSHGWMLIKSPALRTIEAEENE